MHVDGSTQADSSRVPWDTSEAPQSESHGGWKAGMPAREPTWVPGGGFEAVC